MQKIYKIHIQDGQLAAALLESFDELDELKAKGDRDWLVVWADSPEEAISAALSQGWSMTAPPSREGERQYVIWWTDEGVRMVTPREEAPPIEKGKIRMVMSGTSVENIIRHLDSPNKLLKSTLVPPGEENPPMLVITSRADYEKTSQDYPEALVVVGSLREYKT